MVSSSELGACRVHQSPASASGSLSSPFCMEKAFWGVGRCCLEPPVDSEGVWPFWQHHWLRVRTCQGLVLSVPRQLWGDRAQGAAPLGTPGHRAQTPLQFSLCVCSQHQTAAAALQPWAGRGDEVPAGLSHPDHTFLYSEECPSLEFRGV